ncbi:MAG: hypothetical protein IKD66_04625 [Solobacterium sp.]|nr:hypothetical protein [Solobacterium sp.]
MELKEIRKALSDEDLDEVSGGKKYTIKENRWMFCPYCQNRHNISVMAGKHRVGAHMYTLYRCNRKGLMFVKAVNGYFNMNDERLPGGTVVVD